jgi:hypothetical protein
MESGGRRRRVGRAATTASRRDNSGSLLLVVSSGHPRDVPSFSLHSHTPPSWPNGLDRRRRPAQLAWMFRRVRRQASAQIRRYVQILLSLSLSLSCPSMGLFSWLNLRRWRSSRSLTCTLCPRLHGDCQQRCLPGGMPCWPLPPVSALSLPSNLTSFLSLSRLG